MARLQCHYSPSELLRVGPTIKIEIGPHPDEQTQRRLFGINPGQRIKVKALIDTGSSITLINKTLFETCQFRVTGETKVVTVDSKTEQREYSAYIQFPESTLEPVLTNIVDSPHDLTGRPFSCLIGRDVLSRWCLKLDFRRGELFVE